MGSLGGRLGRFRPCLLAGLALLLAPGVLSAEVIVIRNETKASVVVQTTIVVRGVLRRDRPHLVEPNEKAPPIALPGDKLITIYDPKAPNRVLFEGVVPSSPIDHYFAIVPGPTPPKLKLEKRKPPPNR